MHFVFFNYSVKYPQHFVSTAGKIYRDPLNCSAEICIEFLDEFSAGAVE